MTWIPWVFVAKVPKFHFQMAEMYGVFEWGLVTSYLQVLG